MKSNTPTLPGVIRAAIKAALIDVHTAIPGRVLSYDKTKQVATVQPIVRKDATTKLPAIPGVSVMFLGNDTFSLTWPVKKGDTGWLMFAESSLDKWKTGGGDDVDPGDDRRFDLSDAVFIPALRSQKRPVPATGVHDTALVLDGPDLHLGGDKELVTREEFRDFVDNYYKIHTHPAPGGTTSAASVGTVSGSAFAGTSKLKGG